ncbi:MAG: site-2 protease family protein [Planctomycetota bacterium]|nr:site-2 protease family protein [Planctomycetota bacterium]
MDGISLTAHDLNESQRAAGESSQQRANSSVELLEQRPSARAELQFTHDESAQRWIVFDPAMRKTIRIGEVEYALLKHCDGKSTVSQIYHAMRAQYPTICSEPQWLIMQLTRFWQNTLVSGFGDSDSPRLRASRSHWAKAIQTITVWRLPGINADAWLERWSRSLDVLFSRRAALFWSGFTVFSAIAALLNFDRLLAQGMSWQMWMQPQSFGLLFVVFVVTRALHELGHAFACKRFGVRCPDIGLLMILGTPCVYCDVSESWKLKKRWQRAAIAAAGIYVELVVAAIAFWVWCYTRDGAANTVALHIITVCSLSTLVVNANPLMRFDGYYILADWIDQANLRRRADDAGSNALQSWLLGPKRNEPASPDSVAAKEWGYVLFAFSCWTYRVLLASTIAGILVMIYSRWQLVWIGRTLAVVVIAAMIIAPLVRFAGSLVRRTGEYSNAWRPRFRLAIIATMLLATFFLLPIPGRRSSTGWVQPFRSHGIYIPSDSRLAACYVEDGSWVRAGTRLFQLKNPDLQLQYLRRRAAAEQAKTRLQALQRERDMHQQEVELVVAKTDVATRGTLAANAFHELELLQLSAKYEGVFTSAMLQPAEEAEAAYHPVSYTNMSKPPGAFNRLGLHEQLGRWLRQGTLLGMVHSRESLAVLPLRDSQLADLAAGTEVRLRLDWQGVAANDVAMSQIERITLLEDVEQTWIAGSQPEFQTRPGEGFRYAAIVPIPERLKVAPGAKVNAVFVSPSSTAARWCYRWLQANLTLAD